MAEPIVDTGAVPTGAEPDVKTEDVNAGGDPAATKTETGTPEGGAGGAKPEGEAAKIEIPEEKQRDWKRVTTALKNLQAERDRIASERDDLKAKLTTGQPAPGVLGAEKATTATTAAHPALRGIQFDEDGIAVVDGVYVTMSQLLEKAQMREDIDEIRKELHSKAQFEADQKEAADLKALNDELAESVTSTIHEQVPLLLSGLTGKAADRAEAKVHTFFREFMNEAVRTDEDLSPETITKGIAHAFAEYREIGAENAAAQLKGNADYKTEHPVPPGGQPGIKTVADPWSLTGKERKARIAEAEKAALRSK
jgi:hypothetical protein